MMSSGLRAYASEIFATLRYMLDKRSVEADGILLLFGHDQKFDNTLSELSVGARLS